MLSSTGRFTAKRFALTGPQASSYVVTGHSERTFHSTNPVQDSWQPWGPGQSGDVEKFKPWERRAVGGHAFPDWIEKWSRKNFYIGGGVLSGTAVALTAAAPTSLTVWAFNLLVSGYWWRGFSDMKQTRHSIRRNFPVLGNVRYFFESLRPEIRQYFIEGEREASPFHRADRSTVYQRAKLMTDTLPFGARMDMYESGYEWLSHSVWPKHVPEENKRITVGGPHCKQPYSASIFNISAMSFGAISENAILALNEGAKMGNFYHNTGEGGISRFHLRPGGDIVWNVGTGYFGCRDVNGNFCPESFKENALRPQVKMIEIKLSQGAKPAHGGILPRDKITPIIAEARGLKNLNEDCVSPPRHTAFATAVGLIEFVQRLRDLSGGKPIGFKMCLGRPDEFAAILHAMIKLDITPDFITIDGAEGGTGAAPPEFSNRVGVPLLDGLTLVNNMMIGCGIRDRIKVICSGKIITGFHLVKHLALGADLCNSARGMMFALGCIQALKCNTNKCPSGVATQDKDLMAGLDVATKAVRVHNFHQKTVEAAMELIGAVGLTHPDDLQPDHVVKRISQHSVMPFSKLFPTPEPGSLLEQAGPKLLQRWWNEGAALVEKQLHP